MTLSPSKSHGAGAENHGAESHGTLPNEGARIQRQLANAIYEHRVKPGTKLPELDLCGIYGTTRGVIRKVLDRLASEQLVELIPNRGAFVAQPSVELTRDTYSLRRILEAGVVRTLAKNAKRPWLKGVRLQVGEEREANRVGDTGRYIQLAGKFHLDLAAATGNSALEQHLNRVVSQTSLMTALYDVPGTNSCSVHEHLEILDAIEAGDYANAERLMEDHLIGCERQLRLDQEDTPGLDLAQALGGLRTEPPATAATGIKPITKRAPGRNGAIRKLAAKPPPSPSAPSKSARSRKTGGR
jgi:DNA-binding GntR family transcriptional regulator